MHLSNCDHALYELMLAKQFECVLKKDAEPEVTRGVFFSLMRFQRCHYPDDKDSMRMVYICFNIQREVCDLRITLLYIGSLLTFFISRLRLSFLSTSPGAATCSSYKNV
jgi:hypothetical protein